MSFHSNDLLQCKMCNNQLKGTPIILSCCGETICQRHVDDENRERCENNNINSFTCDFCNHVHDMSNKRFVTNKMVENILRRELTLVNVKVEQKLQSARDIANEIGDLIKDPDFFIYEEVSGLMRVIDLRREELIDEISKLSLGMIDDLNAFRVECNNNLRREEIVEGMARLEEENFDSLIKLDDWSIELSALTLSESKRMDIYEKASLFENQMKIRLQDLKDKLLLDTRWIHAKNLKFSIKNFRKELISIKGYFDLFS